MHKLACVLNNIKQDAIGNLIDVLVHDCLEQVLGTERTVVYVCSAPFT